MRFSIEDPTNDTFQIFDFMTLLRGLSDFVRSPKVWHLRFLAFQLGVLKESGGRKSRLRYNWYERLLASLWGWEFAWFATSRLDMFGPYWIDSDRIYANLKKKSGKGGRLIAKTTFTYLQYIYVYYI